MTARDSMASRICSASSRCPKYDAATWLARPACAATIAPTAAASDPNASGSRA